MSEQNVEKDERQVIRDYIARGGNASAAIVSDLLDALDRVDALAEEWTAEHRRAESHAGSPDIPLGRAARLMRAASSIPSEGSF